MSVELSPPPAAAELSRTTAESLRLATAPSTGRFRPGVAADARVADGEVIGWITGGNGRADEVRSPAAGTVRAHLARPGQLVQHRRALLWIDAAA